MVSKFKMFQGGVERHLFDLAGGLTDRGYDVQIFSSEDVAEAGGTVFTASASGIGRVTSAASLLWNPYARALLKQAVEDFQPDVIHYHSISHQLSPSVLRVSRMPAIMTLHDYKLSAPCYTLYRDGEVCTACVGRRLAMPAIRYKCVKDSFTGSALCALEDVTHRHRHRSAISRFIVPSKFARDVAVRGGLPADQISVIPWGAPSAHATSDPHSPNVAFFGGRLHRTKGLQILLQAWMSLPSGHGCVLRVAGEGELESEVRRMASADPSIRFLGMLPGQQVRDEIRRAAVAVVPSLFPETLGLSALEALSSGTPVLSSGRGALADFCGEGVWTLPSVDEASVVKALQRLLIHREADILRGQLKARDLSAYGFDRMIAAIEEEYRRATLASD